MDDISKALFVYYTIKESLEEGVEIVISEINDDYFRIRFIADDGSKQSIRLNFTKLAEWSKQIESKLNGRK